MEVKNHNSLRSFELVDKGVCIHINSPLLDSGLNTFKEKRLFYNRFKALEKKIKKSWSARTDIQNAKMIRILTKLGAIVWWIDLKKDKIYFFKPRKNDESI